MANYKKKYLRDSIRDRDRKNSVASMKRLAKKKRNIKKKGGKK